MKALTRRKFLQSSLSGAGMIIAASIMDGGVRLLSADQPAPEGFEPNVWLKISPDEAVTVLLSKSEMGQGVSTSLPMLVADELEADWKQVRVEFAPADEKFRDPLFGMQATGGSTSIRHMHDVLRTAGAAAREMLVQAAAQEWGVSAAECSAQQGAVRHAASGRRLSYGGLCAKAAALPVPEKPVLKEAKDLRLIGKAWPQLDMAGKVNGTTKFGIDAFLPDMLYGAVARPPAYGAKALSFDDNAARAVSGVRSVVETESGVAVCADTLEAAWAGRGALSIRWSPGTWPDWSNEALDKLLEKSLSEKGITARDEGDASAALVGAAKKLEASYRVPYLYHATMEPMNCTADVRADQCRIWVPTQNQSGVRRTAATVTGLKPHQIEVHTTFLGGGFGRRFEQDFVAEALRLSMACGRPVKLIWTREEDAQNDFYRPASLCRISAGLDDQGRLVAWSHKTAAASIFARAFPGGMRNGIDPAAVEGVGDTIYDIPNLKVEWVKVEAPVPVGFWRSVGNSINAFTMESFMDELAHAAGKDPIEFRLAHLSRQPRPRRLLEALKEKSGWGKPLPAGRGLGVAQHFSFGTYAAHVAEVSVDKKSGAVTVHRIVCAADCGSVINANTAAAQLEGATLMGLSAALKEEMSFAAGGVASDNFHNYQILRISEAPEVEAHLLPSGEALGGLGEPGLPPVAPAVANAIFAACGARVRRLPLTPAAVLEALGG